MYPKGAFSTLMRRKERVYGDCTHTVQICVGICVRIQIYVMYISMYGCIKRGVFNVDEEEGMGLRRQLFTHVTYPICMYIVICKCIHIMDISKRGVFNVDEEEGTGLWRLHTHCSNMCIHMCTYTNRCNVYINVRMHKRGRFQRW